MNIANKSKENRAEVPRITDGEWTIMKVVWAHKTTTAKQVVEALASETAWKIQTIQTLMSRLVQRGALAADKSAREHTFTALVTEQECRQDVSRSFLARVFDGEIAPFLACLLERKKLTRKEIAELKRILEEKTP
ncbi:MAG: BlaI/MecI/CopY family transcriptional regulator [Verrucomicrobia bacterium]|nr:BlaI/MecI/CopY family transcriptional regulator [Verrucomicrobiota bacterium]